MKGIRKAGSVPIARRIVTLLLLLSAASILTILFLIFLLFDTNRSYTVLLQNATAAADFNTAFKTTIDSEMYIHVIHPRNEVTPEDLPTDELDRVEAILDRLEETTTLPDNIWRIHSMRNMCGSLRGYMTEIYETESYDSRMEKLDRNIRGETGLTRLIETYMHDYLDEEVREMSRLQASLRARTFLLTICTLAAVAALCVSFAYLSARVTRGIAEPIKLLSRKADRFGEGDFSPMPVETHITELRTLSDGFDEMAARIRNLMDRQIEDQKSLHRAELELLQAQINPHFLYNTLDSIAILAQNDRQEEAADMVKNLSSFFRISLSKGKDIISLESERNHVRSYLEIQHVRYSDILEFSIDIDEDILDRYVPKLILQPLVENALYHGIKNRRGMGRIDVRGFLQDGLIHLTVTDNGVGMSEEQLRVLQAGIYNDNHSGLGLINVHKRIRLYCGDEYGLSFTSELGKGTCVTILLPGDLSRSGSPILSQTEASK